MSTDRRYFKHSTVILLIVLTSCNISKNKDNMSRKNINIIGIAQNGKAGAMIQTKENSTYYIDNLDYWEDTELGKEIEVSGVLKKETFTEADLKDESGAWKQGMIGEKLTLLNPKWKIIN